MANSMSVVNRVSLAVKALFKKYPMASNAVVYGTLITGAEFTQQTITKKILVSCMLPQWPLWHLHCFYLTCIIAGITYSMEQSPSGEADQFSASLEIPRILWTRRFITAFTHTNCWNKIPKCQQITAFDVSVTVHHIYKEDVPTWCKQFYYDFFS